MWPGFFKAHAKPSFSQCGEDLIIQFIFNALKRPATPFLDIGAHHPVKGNNTYGLYRQGARGVCIEPNPDLFSRLKRARGRDVCLNAGLAAAGGKLLDFYVMRHSTLSTFSREEAERLQDTGQSSIEKVCQVPTITPADVLARHFSGGTPAFVSLDVEGLEEEIIAVFLESGGKPDVFCIETLTYSRNNEERKKCGLIDLVARHGYLAYADTYINTIFVSEHLWRNRPRK